MAQDQNVPPEMMLKVERLISKDGTVPQDQVPLETVTLLSETTPRWARVPVHDDDLPEVAPAFRHVPDGKIWHIGDAVRDWTYQSLCAVVKGERVGWDVSLTLAPAAGGAFVSAYALVIYMPSVLLGQPPIGTVRIIPDHPDQNQVRAAVLSAVGELKDKQNEMLGS